jgi:hypothetical protein
MCSFEQLLPFRSMLPTARQECPGREARKETSFNYCPTGDPQWDSAVRRAIGMRYDAADKDRAMLMILYAFV